MSELYLNKAALKNKKGKGKTRQRLLSLEKPACKVLAYGKLRFWKDSNPIN